MQDTYWNIEQVAKYLGVSPRTVRRLMKHKRLPHSKIGGKLIRYSKPSIDKWVEMYQMGASK